MADILKIGPDLKDGPEFKFFKNFTDEHIMCVFIIDLKNDDMVIAEGKINYANPDHRKWLGKVTFWATNNGYAIETVALKDVD